jgi:heme-degrading monooxygenase HmoA
MLKHFRFNSLRGRLATEEGTAGITGHRYESLRYFKDWTKSRLFRYFTKVNEHLPDQNLTGVCANGVAPLAMRRGWRTVLKNQQAEKIP